MPLPRCHYPECMTVMKRLSVVNVADGSDAERRLGGATRQVGGLGVMAPQLGQLAEVAGHPE